MYLFTNEGKMIRNIIEMPESVEYLIVSEKKEFKNISFDDVEVDNNLENHLSIKNKVFTFQD